ncbi:MAG: hypothetical protein LWY06_14335 [Firmicutes bacterium]|nr:hypothetical protein [Bacillota bacterium]
MRVFKVKSRILLIIIAGVLAFVFLNGRIENCFHNSNDELRLPYCVALPDNTEMVAFADYLPWNGETDKPDYKNRKIYLYAIDGSSLNNKKLIYMKGYGKFSDLQFMNERVELVDNPDNTLWKVYSEDQNFDVKFLTSIDFVRKGLQIGRLTKGLHVDSERILFTNISSDGKFIMTHFGDVLSEALPQGFFFTGKYYKIDGNLDTSKDEIPSAYGSILIDDNHSVLQAQGKEVTVKNANSYFQENEIYFVSKTSLSYVVNDGIFPGSNNMSISNIPLGLSPEKDKLAYWVYVQEEKGGVALWLSTIGVSDKRQERIVKLLNNSWKRNCSEYWDLKNQIQWSPDPSRPLIATTVEGKIIIVDVNAKKIIREIAIKMPRSLRWSSDGKKLGFLIDDMIYSYNVEKDTLTQVGRIKGCFDFLWVPEGGR